MPESSLSFGYDNLLLAVGDFLGFRRDVTAYSADEISQCDRAIDAGYRRFLNPPAVLDHMTGRMSAHQWSFLHLTGTQATAAADYDYDLPANYGFPEGPVAFAEGEGFGALIQRNEAQIRAYRQNITSTGRPIYFAVRAKVMAAADGVGQRFELLLHPTPGGEYNLVYPYHVVVDSVKDMSYPYGGAQHTETIRQACLAAAEEAEDEEGIHNKRFLECLTASISADRRQGSANFGYNGDHSDRGGLGKYERTAGVTVYGLEP